MVSELPALAEFLRSRRERLSPERAGLTPNGRRRTPGLRREEVATIAGMSVDYLVRLEQGRDTNPSPDVLLALAEALQLDDLETGHLMALVTVGNSPRMERFCPSVPTLEADVAPTVRSMLDGLDPTPAHVVGAAGTVAASNSSWRDLVAPLGLGDGSNLVRHVFERPDVYVDHDRVADGEVARLRLLEIHHDQDDGYRDLLHELMDDPAFARRWEERPEPAPSRGNLGLHHPDLGALSLDYEVMALATDGQHLVCWLAADAATAAALDRLTVGVPVSPAQLRVVGDA